MWNKLKIKRLDKHFSVLASLHKAYNAKEEVLFKERLIFRTLNSMKQVQASENEIKKVEQKYIEIHGTVNSIFLNYYMALEKAKANLSPELITEYLHLLERTT